MAAARHAEIAGAGFAGLVAAISLRQRGWTVRVHEASRELRLKLAQERKLMPHHEALREGKPSKRDRREIGRLRGRV